ncbi:MAG: SPOR domain-containing protein [Ignavibacteria bacterium]|nr:SPOR domain-containing protein [Ignavibacteria bacterium]
MRYYIFLILGLLILLNGCSSKIEQKDSELSKEQVDLSKIDPLAQFNIEEESLKDFDTFKGYSEKKIKTKEKQKSKEQIPPSVYYVQVGLTDTYEEILQLKNQITLLFPDEKIEIKYDAPFYRILIGPFKSKSEATEIFSILESKNFSSIRIRTETSK